VNQSEELKVGTGRTRLSRNGWAGTQPASPRQHRVRTLHRIGFRMTDTPDIWSSLAGSRAGYQPKTGRVGAFDLLTPSVLGAQA